MNDKKTQIHSPFTKVLCAEHFSDLYAVAPWYVDKKLGAWGGGGKAPQLEENARSISQPEPLLGLLRSTSAQHCVLGVRQVNRFSATGAIEAALFIEGESCIKAVGFPKLVRVLWVIVNIADGAGS